MFCTNCGRPMEKDQEICNFCKDLSETKFNYCQYCGEKIVGDSSICTHCEQKLKGEVADDGEGNKEESIKNLINYIKKRSKISIVLWLLVTILEIVLVSLFNKIYPFYVAPILNIYFIVNSIKYCSLNESNIIDVIDNMKKRLENIEIISGFMIFVGVVVGGLPAYYDVKTIKKSISDANAIK